MSIIFVGVGKNKQNFRTLIKLDADKRELKSTHGEKAVRDIVQFVDYNKHKNNYANLVKETLKEIPKQFINFMELNNILPINHEENKKKKRKPKIDASAIQTKKVKHKHAYFQNMKNTFIKDCLKLGFKEEAVHNLANKGVMSLDINFAFEFLTTQQKLENEKKLNKGNTDKQARDEGEGDIDTKPENDANEVEDFDALIEDNGVFFKRVKESPKKDFKPQREFMLY